MRRAKKKKKRGPSLKIFVSCWINSTDTCKPKQNLCIALDFYYWKPGLSPDVGHGQKIIYHPYLNPKGDTCPCKHLTKIPIGFDLAFAFVKGTTRNPQRSAGEDKVGTLDGSIFLFYPSVCKHTNTEVWDKTPTDWYVECVSNNFTECTSIV